MTSAYKGVFRTVVVLLSFFIAFQGKAQKIDTISTFSISGYIDAYYAYYTDSVGAGALQKFPTISPRSNNPSINTAQLSVQYTGDKVRGVTVLHFGDIAAATWAAGTFHNIQEAHLGVKLAGKLWIDAGFFRSHFGTEYLLPVENITSSVSVGYFYEPYYESGIRLNFDPSAKLDISVYLLNGYGVYVDNNSKKSLGVALAYQINDYVGVGYTNYIGDDAPDGTGVSRLRTDQNAFVNWQRKKFRLQVGGDFCLQKNSDLPTGTKTAGMYTGLVTVSYSLLRQFDIYGRGEVFSDPDGFLSTVIKDAAGRYTGYKLWGATLGTKVKPTGESYVRLEGRLLKMQQDQYIFMTNGEPVNWRFEVMVNAGVSFDLLKKFGTKGVDK